MAVNFASFNRPSGDPFRCLSSQLTTELLKFRNPQKEGEEWLLQNEDRGSLPIFAGRVIVAEIGVCLLFVTATVESVAYSILLIGSLPLLFVSKRPLDFAAKAFSSSGFTMFWNAGNATVFNFFSINAVTHESFARFAMDHWPRGQIVKLVMRISYFILKFFSPSHQLPYSNLDFLNHQHVREEDRIHIALWSRDHNVVYEHQDLDQVNVQMIRNEIQQYALNTVSVIDEGVKFFNEEILEKIDSNTKDLVVESDADVMHFVLTRCVHYYVFGLGKQKSVPSFLNKEVCEGIERLRSQPKSTPVPDFADVTSNHKSFNENQVSSQDLTIFNDLKGVAYLGLQNSPLFFKCWETACKEFSQRAQ